MNDIVSLHTIVTRNILIPYADGTYDFNVYGDAVQIIASAISAKPPFKHMRFESKIMPFKELNNEVWSKFEEDCKKHFKENLDKASSVNQLPTKVTI